MGDFRATTKQLVDSGVISPIGTECCVLTAQVLRHHADMLDVYTVGSQWWKDANVWDPADLFSSVRAAADIASRVKGKPSTYAILQYDDGVTWKRISHHLELGRWYFAQGWRKGRQLSGHTFLFKTHKNSRQGAEHFIESSTTRGLRMNEEPVFLPDRLLEYQRGFGLAELW